MAKALGDTEKTVLVGGLILAVWLGIDAYVSRIEQRDKTSNNGTTARSSGRRSRFGRAAGRRRMEAA
ncbi:MAG: hypothetical protein AB1Z98_02220 [Nannocystaceae bacterium]